MLKTHTRFLILIILLLHAVTANSQITKDTTSLSEVRIIASPTTVSLQKMAAAVASIPVTEVNSGDGSIVTSVLNKIPGVYMQQGALNTNRISIRGMGARSQYGTTKIKSYFENIPLTTAEGESTIEDIDMENIGRIEIVKGPNSTSSGSGLGGVIHLFAKDIPAQTFALKSATTYGSYGLLKQSFSGVYSQNTIASTINYNHLQSDGFRQNSAYDRKSVSLLSKLKINTTAALSLVAIYTRLKAYIPSSINEDDFTNHPEKAANNWLQAQGYESYDKLQLGLGYQQQFTNKWSFKSSVFSTFKEAYEPRPFDILADKISNLGFRTSLNYNSSIGSLPFELSLGTEILIEKYQYSLFENNYQSNQNQGSLAGAKFTEAEQNRNYSNYFLQSAWSLSSDLQLEAGLSLNSTSYTLLDILEPNNSPKKTHRFADVVSPRMGLSYQIASLKNLYASVSKGFSLPSVAETLNPDGQINTDLQSEIGWNYEVGFKGNWMQKRLYSELAFFSTQITNLLVARRTAADQYIGINAGASSHQGMEFTLNYQLLQTSNWQLTSYLSAAMNHFKFKDFIDGTSDYSGNQLTGVPSSQYTLGLDFNTAKGFSLNTSFLKVGPIPLNDANSKYAKHYELINIKASYMLTLLQQLKTTFSAGINNATNTHYAASILPNAVGFGGSKPRYYYPGNPRNYYTAITLNYLF